MPWMKTVMIVEGGDAVDTVVNTDTISRFGAVNADVTYLKFSDGTSIHVRETMQEIIDVVLQADAKKAK